MIKSKKILSITKRTNFSLSKKSKAQSSVEFALLMSFMIFLFSVFFVLIGQKLLSLQNEKNEMAADSVKKAVETELSLASTVQNGYSRDFYLPYTLQGRDYQIYAINDTEVVIYVGKAETFLHLNNFTGNITKGWNHITKFSGLINVTPIDPNAVLTSLPCVNASCNPVPTTNNSLQCQVRASCAVGEVPVFRFADTTHAEISTLNNYPNVVCCAMDASLGLQNDCGTSFPLTILKLSAQTNAHVEFPSNNNYLFPVCLGSNNRDLHLYCTYSGSCTGNQTCLASVSSFELGLATTNLHVAGCNSPAYVDKICCSGY